MSVVDNRTVDGIALTENKTEIILLITDHLDWEDEYEHLTLLQEKINAYVSFIEEKQYVKIYPCESIAYSLIEIHFLHNLTYNAEKFIHTVNNQLKEFGIGIRYYISEGE